MSNYYFDLKPTMLDPTGLDLLADLVLERAATLDAQCIGGLVMGAVPIVIATLLKSRGTKHPLQGFWVQKEAKDHGEQSLADGYLSDGSNVIVVEDVTTSGGSGHAGNRRGPAASLHGCRGDHGGGPPGGRAAKAWRGRNRLDFIVHDQGFRAVSAMADPI